MKAGNPKNPHPLAEAMVSNKHLMGLILLVLLVAGFSAITGLPRLEDPIISNRNAQILTFFPGADAERVEALISEPLELVLKEVSAIKDIESISRAGISLIAIELADAVNEETNDAVFSEIRDKVNDAAATFPEQALPPEFDDKRGAVAFTLIASLRWEDGREDDLSILNRNAEALADQLRAVIGTDLVRVFGTAAEEIRVIVREDELTALGMPLSAVSAALRKADAKVPAGVLRSESSELLLEITGELDSVQRIREVPLRTLPDGRTVRLGDVAEVSRAVQDPPQEIALRDGQRAVFVAARVKSDQRVDAWSTRAEATLVNFKEGIGGSIVVDEVFNQNSYTSARLGELFDNLWLGAVVVFLVVLLTMGWRSSWIVSLSLPLVSAFTLFVVAMLGGKLHQMSIFGMIIALGLLVDTAIVITDEVRLHLRNGASAIDAVSSAIRQLFMPLLSSMLTTVFSFMPILLLPGSAGDFVSSIAVSVIVALIGSFLISMTVIAGLAGIFGKESDSSRLPRWLRNGVGRASEGSLISRGLGWLMRRPAVTVLLSLIVPLIGLGFAITLGSQFFPRTDRDMFEVEVTLPTDTSISRTRSVAKAVDALIREEPDVTKIDWIIGGSFPTVYYNLIMNQDGVKNYAHGIITTTDFQAVSRMIDGLQQKLDERFPEAQILLTKFAQGPPADADVEIRLSGPDIETLQTLGEQVRLCLVNHPGILHTRTSLPRGEPKLWLETDEIQTQLMGLQLTDVAEQIQTAYEGIVGGSVLEDIETLPVRVRRSNTARESAADLQQFNLSLPEQENGAAQWTPVSAIAKQNLRPEQGGITRRNGLRVNKIHGFTYPDRLPIEVANEVMASLKSSEFRLPPGYRMELGGESENQGEAVGNLLLYLPIILVIIVAILILSFRSVRMAGILLLGAPLSAGFGLLATWAMGLPLSFNTILGCMGLIGLAFNDSIVVLANIQGDERARAGDPDAIRDVILGCSRHLIATTLSTIGSFLPLLIFVGGSFWPPLAIVLAGGVGGATLLAVSFTPAMYRLLFRPKSAAAVIEPASASGFITTA